MEYSDNESDEEFLTPGLEYLQQTRKEILNYSLKLANSRILSFKNQDFIKILNHRRSLLTKLGQYECIGTQSIPINKRTLSSIKFHKDRIITGGWDGNLYFLNKEDLAVLSSGSGHTDKVNGLDIDSKLNLLVSGGGEGNISLWNLPETFGKEIKPSSTINAHTNRVTSTTFHPLSNYVISTSFDQTWKLWDITKQVDILTQEGHDKAVFTGCIHPDGGLFVSSGLDGVSHIWDLRSGQSISQLQKHAQGVYSSDFSPNGYQLVTASGDCSVKVWDIRYLNKPEFTIPSHTKLVSLVKFFKRTEAEKLSEEVSDEFGNNKERLDSNGTFLATSSYDGLINIWSSDNWLKIKSLKGHSDKVMCLDIDGDGGSIVSTGWDRTVKLWCL